MNNDMSSLQQTSRFLPFSNSNIQRKQISAQGGLPQSLSGSDTDVSTSNENLSNEERYVIRHTARQEPQGQENQQQSPSRSSSHKENIPNIQGNLLNRNSLKDSLSGSNRNSLKESLNGSNRNSLKDSINGSNRNSLKESLSNRTSVGSNRSSLDVSTSSYNTLIIHNANEESSWTPSGRLSGLVRDHGDMGYLYCEGGGKGHSNSPTMQSLSSLPHDDHLYEQPGSGGCQEITDIPDDYLSQSQVLKHLAKEVKVPSYSKLTGNDSSIDVRMRDNDRGKQTDYEDRPPPSYTTTLLPLKSKHRLLGPTEKLTLSRSQPDLSRIGKVEMENYDPRTTSPRPQTKGREDIETSAGEIWPPSAMVQIVIQENSALKLELERCYNKVAKSQKLEQEIAKVHRAHEELAASCERREKLERAARLRLQSDCRRLTELNRALRDQIDLLSSRTDTPPIVESMRKELTQRELLIGQLITQNKELAAAKERQEIELAAQRATLQEQRTHIDILDTALTNAQGNVVRLEEECRKKQVYVERVGQLQRALSSLQASSDRREETERQLRGQLERELREGGGGGGAHGNENSVNGETIADLKRRLRERDEKIMSLEGDVAKWEQRYLEESALRQAAIDAASLPKDAKIAALEKTSQDAEKMIAEARSEKMRHMDEVHAAQKKLADLESRMKDLESKLAERDAMIRVLQKHTYDKDSSCSSGVGSYPAAHSSHSSTSADHHTVLTSTPELVSSVLGGGSGYGSTGSYGVTDSYKYRKQGSFEQTNKSLDDQLKELDSQLLSKRALCCFPGFSNPGTASRKGKIPKPLLAGVNSAGSSSTASSKSRLLDDSGGEASGSLMEFAASTARFKGTVSRLSVEKPEEMILLEKQGRSSQRQRMQEGEPRRAGSLPPSSLPRPPRSLKSTNSRYCRLSDSEARKKSDPGPVIDTGMKIETGMKIRDSGNCTLEYDTRALRRKKSSGSETFSQSTSLKKGSSPGCYERLGEAERKKQMLEVKHRETQGRSLIPPPSRRIGEYGRLSDGDGKGTLRKQGFTRGQSTGSTVSSKSGRDSGGTASSEASTSSLPPTRARSIPRPNYRIQF
ncbi:angiomotin-like protein 1 [Belonocnema kinseyi]|uniref:angiomotin-like protein 1 n=1 Tax=Belonocnema kinseyi TaxID=2817044 RepID=UPI00143D4D1B|nr:angiomotin-like protein 1 [Belonocnema kinseyi]XP_033231420.1 angiomotin-like protein 1 [Belonocnema kinseyi]XP_033231421.1 angiomotin-like protein 1 [Belonocnema kinseyi]XP_033231422.1 angiomotin-like protein 1 [Belonocnema kinseyi]